MNVLSVCLELSQSCRVGCPYCLLEEKCAEGSLAEWLSIIDELNRHGVMRFTLGGAEPLEVPYLYDVVAHILYYGKIALLRTSACKPIDVNKAALFSIVDVSIDSNDAEVLAVCKPNIDPGIVFNNIEQLLEAGVPVRCNILLTKYNYEHIDEFVTFLGLLGVKALRLQKLVRRGLAKKTHREFELSEEELDYSIAKATIAANACGISVSVLSTVTEETLCIIKPDGGVFRGNPTGIIPVGNIFNDAVMAETARYLGESQLKHYGYELGLL